MSGLVEDSSTTIYKTWSRPVTTLYNSGMKRLRRNYVHVGTYFFSLVTHERRPILTTDLARRCLREAIQHQQARRPFKLCAIVLLPDHLHTIWQLPPGDCDYSLRWGQIKEHFTRQFLAGGGKEGHPTQSRDQHRERAIWQHRFWEHTIESDDDFKQCLDYIHWNPVKHGLADKPNEYPWSSFKYWVSRGEYDPDWGNNEVPDIHGAEWD